MVDESSRQFLFWVVTAGVGAAHAWLLRIEGRQNRQDAALGEIRLHVAENYASNAAVDKLAEKLDRALEILARIEGREEARG